MKKLAVSLSLILLVIIVFACAANKRRNSYVSRENVEANSVLYKDGQYSGTSRSSYTSEPYWGIVNFNVKNGLISDIKFIIRDSSLHETFNGAYEKHFQGNDIYIEQCRKDWQGVQSYPKKLFPTQKPENIDAISGATWSYNLFQASIKEALKNKSK